MEPLLITDEHSLLTVYGPRLKGNIQLQKSSLGNLKYKQVEKL